MVTEIRAPNLGDLETLRCHLPDSDGMSHEACLKGHTADRGIYLVAWAGDVPVGRLFLAWQNSEIPRILQTHPQARQFSESPEIRDVYVDPGHRSRGIGTHLIREALACADRHTACGATICVNVDNPRARALYERLGFSEPGIGVFTTEGTFTDKDGNEAPWQNGPQLLLARESSNARADVPSD
ncbi:GNAT family N-acetyltransferase [Candidatus Latescibacterota bacterium]